MDSAKNYMDEQLKLIRTQLKSIWMNSLELIRTQLKGAKIKGRGRVDTLLLGHVGLEL